MSEVKTARPEAEVADVLGLGRKRRRWLPWVLGLGALGLLLLVAIVGAVLATRGGNAWQSDQAKMGDITLTVVAVGKVEPKDTVAIGSELSGIVKDVLVDVNDHVKAGQTLATLDTSLLNAQAQQARAQVQSAQASLTQAQVGEAAAKLALGRATSLSGTAAQSVATLDDAKSAYAKAQAAVGVTRAQLSQARAARDAAEVNLAKAVIKSPIDGVVLERNVEPGQAVVSALQAATLFSVAADLSQMTVSVEVDEADIGRLKVGQHATFTVAAWPDRVFDAVVDKVHPAPIPNEAVVAYTAELSLKNPDNLLKPGMTATVEIVTDDLKNVLLVPDAALRFEMPHSDLPPLVPEGGKHWARVWVLKDGKPKAVKIVPGASDGKHTVVLEGDVKPGDTVITGLSANGGA